MGRAKGVWSGNSSDQKQRRQNEPALPVVSCSLDCDRFSIVGSFADALRRTRRSADNSPVPP